jgi:hypothetical protein
MDNFFAWLSASPVAAAVVLSAFGLAVVIALVAFFQGRSVTIWPIKISAKPSASKGTMQVGEVLYEVATDALKSGAQGRRWDIRKVEFPQPFQQRPTVIACLSGIDVGDPFGTRINRLFVRAENPTRTGFELRIETWEDTKVHGARAAWIAFGD